MLKSSKVKREKIGLGIPEEFYITTPSRSQVQLRMVSRNLSTEMLLTRTEWERFLKFLRAVQPFGSGERKKRLACGFDFNSGKGVFIIPSDEWWRKHYRKTAKVMRLVRKNFKLERLTKERLRESKQERQTGLLSQPYLSKGSMVVSMPRRHFMKIRQVCLSSWRDIAIMARATKAEG